VLELKLLTLQCNVPPLQPATISLVCPTTAPTLNSIFLTPFVVLKSFRASQQQQRGHLRGAQLPNSKRLLSLPKNPFKVFSRKYSTMKPSASITELDNPQISAMIPSLPSCLRKKFPLHVQTTSLQNFF
jgi:hypothetical protein